jgi:hypothetical protein
VADVVVTPTLDARKLGADLPIFEQRMHEKALEGRAGGLAIRALRARRSGDDLGLDTWMRRQPGTEAGSNLELGLRLGGSASEEHLDRVATGLGANAAPSSEEFAEVGDQGRVAESDPGLGGQTAGDRSKRRQSRNPPACSRVIPPPPRTLSRASDNTATQRGYTACSSEKLVQLIPIFTP